jgi:hypothetical protein
MLGEADEIALDGGGSRRVGDEPGGVDVVRGEGGAEGGRGLVVAGDAEGPDLAAERDEIEADIGGAAGASFGSADIEDGNGGIAGESFGVAIDKLVEHEVADDENTERTPVPECAQQ